MALLPQVSRAIRSLLLRPLYFTSILVTAGLVLLITALAGFITPAQAASFTPHRAAALLQGATGGKQIFDQSCSGCHTIGRGVLIGPDLKDVTKQRDLQWIKDFITDPAKMIASDPAAQQLRKGFS